MTGAAGFYPDKLPQRLWLDFYARRFPTAEVNNTLYRLPERKAFERWAETVPADFRMAPQYPDVDRYHDGHAWAAHTRPASAQTSSRPAHLA